jgi:hypothetical protein
MEEREHLRVVPDIDVFDADGAKVGTVTHVYELGPAKAPAMGAMPVAGVGGAPAATGSMPLAIDGVFEIKTGFLGLGKHYFIPFNAIKDITTGGIFLSTTKANFEAMGWQDKPDTIKHPDRADDVATPRPDSAAVSPAEGSMSSEDRSPAQAERMTGTSGGGGAGMP